LIRFLRNRIIGAARKGPQIRGRHSQRRYNITGVPEHIDEELAMSRLRLLIAISVLLAITVPASAHFGFLFRPRATTAYYYAVPVTVIYPDPVVCIPLDNPPQLFAQPSSAPASSNKEPPLVDPGTPSPSSTESKKAHTPTERYFDAYAVAGKGAAPRADGRSSVSFWNLSAGALALKVGEQRTTLSAGRSVTLNLERRFQWQIEGREVQTAQVAANESGLEIVIRR
jgi:hypothetical protein